MTESSSDRPRLGVLFSGAGRTLENLARCVTTGSLCVDIPIAICSHAGAGGIQRAKEAGIPVEIVDYREHGDDLSSRIVEILEEAHVDWVILAGFIRYFDFPERLSGRVINIHPSLLPDFGGKGFYGDRVHRAVLEASVKVTGCTVHFVDKEYDCGPAILQGIVPVHSGDTAETLGARVFEEECRAFPEAIRLLIEGRVIVEGRKVRIVDNAG